ncbi:hypothetical protein [Paenibacillus alba]|uniref:DUF3221 domain-containing protein n=1 Tax=Paenibacillus alba TaxID=1197127 RepID=A0ABU6G6J3_9BACL|nr:hypothetical protein [Paenibacillus alba]MEC0229791.1 hypothetical protein [Paenibacillus alba]
MKLLISFLIALLMLAGCNQTTHNPTAKEILVQNPNADVFQHKGIIYTNASNIEWVQQTELTIGEKVGVIKSQYKKGLTFENEMATKLPVGVEIFDGGRSILIVKLEGKEIRYLGMIEG